MIPYGDPRKTPQSDEDTEKAQVARRRAAEAKGLFGGPASEKGLGLNFRNADPAPARTTPGGTTTMSFYDTVSRSETAQQAEAHDRPAKLPKAIQQAAQKHPGLALDALEALAFIEKNSKAMGGSPVAVVRGDIARAIGSSPERAEAIVSDLESRSLINRKATAGTLAYFTVRL